MAGGAAVPGAGARGPGAHLDWRRAGAGRRVDRHDRPDGHVGARLRHVHGKCDQRTGFPGRTRQDSVPRARDRADRVRPGARHAGRRGRGRWTNHRRRRAVDLRRHPDQLAVHAPLRRDGHLIMPLSRPHIIVNDLRIGWGTRVLMEHVTFDVERGSTFTILGGSGSGKSTLLRYLIGLEQPLAGTIDIDGLGTPHHYQGVPRFGVLFQSGALFGSMTLAENLALPLTTWTSIRGSLVRELVQAKLDLVGLGAFAEHLPGQI